MLQDHVDTKNSSYWSGSLNMNNEVFKCFFDLKKGFWPAVHCLSPAGRSSPQTAGSWCPSSSSACWQRLRPPSPGHSLAALCPSWKLEVKVKGQTNQYRDFHTHHSLTKNIEKRLYLSLRTAPINDVYKKSAVWCLLQSRSFWETMQNNPTFNSEPSHR